MHIRSTGPALLLALATLAVAHAEPLSSPSPLAAEADGTGSQVDILVPYTTAARTYAGGHAVMRASINTFVALTNQAYANSGIDVTLRLVGTQEVAYTENSNMATDLTRLAAIGDGYMDEIHALRNAVGADLVCLIRRGAAGGAAGIGYLGGANAAYAFTVVADEWAAANLSFPHEVGHNFGCNHDLANAGSTPAGTYNYGHRFVGGNGTQYRTVMAYAPGTRIPYFSNPSVSYQGVPTGIPASPALGADNALLHEETVTNLASYRSQTIGDPSGTRYDFDGDGRPDLVLLNTSTGERAIWLMNGTNRTGIVPIQTGSVYWRLAACADFNADGSSDLVFENRSTGERCIWLMDTTQCVGIVNLPTGVTAWQIAGAGDFNADSKPDLVYQNITTGERCIWLMNGTARLTVTVLPKGVLAWKIAACADFNGDGKPDLAYQNATTGERCIWYMDGTARTSVITLSGSNAAWQITGAADLNNDNQPDMILDNIATGEHAVWFMSGGSRIGIAQLPSTTPGWSSANR